MSLPTRPVLGTDHRPITFQGEFSKKLVTNTFYNLLGRSWSFILTLLLTPYVLRRLDVADFGIWVLFSILINSFNSFAVLDLGLGASIVKHISEYYTHQDVNRIKQVLFSGFVFYVFYGTAQVSLGLLLEKPIFRLLHISGASEDYLLVLLSSSLSNVAAMLLSVIKGVQRMDTSNSLEIRISLLNAIGTVVFLHFGWGIFGLAMNALINVACALLLAWRAVRHIMPAISMGWHFDGKLLRKMFVYGLKLQVSQLGSLIAFRIDRVIVSRFLGVASVSFYEIGS